MIQGHDTICITIHSNTLQAWIKCIHRAWNISYCIKSKQLNSIFPLQFIKRKIGLQQSPLKCRCCNIIWKWRPSMIHVDKRLQYQYSITKSTVVILSYIHFFFTAIIDFKVLLVKKGAPILRCNCINVFCFPSNYMDCNWQRHLALLCLLALMSCDWQKAGPKVTSYKISCLFKQQLFV